MSLFGNKRKDYSIRPPVTNVQGLLTVTDSPNIDFTYFNNNLTANLTPTGVANNTYGSSTLVPVITVDIYGRITSISQVAVSGGGGTYTVDNGLTESPAGNFQLGGNLIQNTIVNGLANFLMTFTSSMGTPFPTLFIQNTGTGYGLWITSNNVGQRITTLPATGNNIQTILELIRGTSGTPAIGMGQEILFRGQSTSGSILTANRIISRLTGVSPSTFASEMLFTVTLNNVEKDVLILLATGQLRLHNYTTSTSFASVSGASVGVLNVDNQGQVFVGAGGGGSILTTDSITGDGTLGNEVKLVNDSLTPGNSKYYGTDGSGTKGFFTLPNTSISPIDGNYIDQTAMIADQGNQLAQYIYFDGADYWEYLGTTNGDITDYRKISDSNTDSYQGQMGRTSSGVVNIATSGTYQATGLIGTLDTVISDGIALSTTDQLGLRNVSGKTVDFKIFASADIDANNNKILGIILAKNGTIIPETECRAPTGNGTTFAKLFTNWIIPMADGDQVTIYVTNHSTSGNITIDRCRMLAITSGGVSSGGGGGSALEILEDGVSVDANVDEINFKTPLKATQTAAGKVDVEVGIEKRINAAPTYYANGLVKINVQIYETSETFEERFEYNSDSQITKKETKDDLRGTWVQAVYTWTGNQLNLPTYTDITLTGWSIT
jgi:hypothetical protein